MLDWFGRKYIIHVPFFEMIIVVQSCGTVRVFEVWQCNASIHYMGIVHSILDKRELLED